MGNYSELVETQMIDFFCSLNERDRRRHAAIEAVKLDHGGIQYISQLLGCHRETVAHGITELNSEERLRNCLKITFQYWNDDINQKNVKYFSHFSYSSNIIKVSLKVVLLYERYEKLFSGCRNSNAAFLQFTQ